MITIQNAESALKNIYLDVMKNDIDTKTNPLLTMIAKNTCTVAGKDAKIYKADGSEIVRPLENLYGTFQISEKAVRAAQYNAGAFANLLNGEMQNLISTSQSGLTKTLYRWLKELSQPIIELEIESAEFDEFCYENGIDLIMCYPTTRRKWFDNLKDLRCNIDVYEFAGGFRGFSISGMPVYSDAAVKHIILQIDEQIATPEEIEKYKLQLEEAKRTVFLVNSSKLGLHQLCDWTWLSNDNGDILRKVDGKPLYQATLVKYANLMADGGVFLMEVGS